MVHAHALGHEGAAQRLEVIAEMNAYIEEAEEAKEAAE